MFRLSRLKKKHCWWACSQCVLRTFSVFLSDRLWWTRLWVQWQPSRVSAADACIWYGCHDVRCFYICVFTYVYRRILSYWIVWGTKTSVYRGTWGYGRSAGGINENLTERWSSCGSYLSSVVFVDLMACADCEILIQIVVIQYLWNSIITGPRVHIHTHHCTAAHGAIPWLVRCRYVAVALCRSWRQSPGSNVMFRCPVLVRLDYQVALAPIPWLVRRRYVAVALCHAPIPWLVRWWH